LGKAYTYLRTMAAPEEKVKQSMGVAAKKYFASKGAKSSMGQKAILHFLGERGTNMLMCLQNAAIKHLGEAKAKALVENVYVLACKAKVLYDAKMITPANTKEFINPINQLAIGIFQVLESRKKSPTKPVDVTPVALKFAQMEAMLTTLLRPLIKEKNLQKVNEVFGYFGSKNFLEMFVNNPEYHEYKATLHKNLKALIKERLEDADIMPPPRQCRATSCVFEALDEDGKFAGSQYCAAHHEEQFKRLLKEPDVHHFLVENGSDYDPFVTIADKYFPPNSRLMYRGCVNYLDASPKIRKIFAEGIWEKYLTAKAPNPVTCLSATCVANIEAKYQTGDLGCFDAALTELKAVFTPLFKQHFLNTEAYKDYIATRRLDKNSSS